MNSAKLQDTRLINIQKSVAFLYINNKLSESRSKKTIASRMKYLRVNLTNEVKEALEELIVLKCPYYPKQSTDFMQSLPKYPWHFSQNWTSKPNICMEPQKTSPKQKQS